MIEWIIILIICAIILSITQKENFGCIHKWECRFPTLVSQRYTNNIYKNKIRYIKK